MGRAVDLKGRLLRKFKINPENSCWEWTSAKHQAGYGVIMDLGKYKLAHRVSFAVHNGPIPEGIFVLHHCDNRCCINPDHLFLGTQADNMADMFSKKRDARGSAHTNAKLTEADVIAIRAARGISQVEIAKQYGMSRVQIQRILSGKRWTEVKGF